MCEDLNSNIDPRLRFKLLPSATIIKGFVQGEKNSNYEIYLLELLNTSAHFKEKGHSNFKSPDDESQGQCDAITENYAIDFKLLSATSRLQASNLFSRSISNLADGLIAIGECKSPEGEIKASNIHVAFRMRDLSDLLQIKKDFKNCRKQCIEKDIFNTLSMLEKRKNLLLFFPYTFSVDEEVTNQELDNIVLHALNYDFSSLFLYRKYVVREFETYFLTIVNEMFYLYKIVDCELSLVEKISCSILPTFMMLKNYCI